MLGRTGLILFALLCSGRDLFAFQLQGKITNKAGMPLSKAVVRLTPQGLSDTTGSDGVYAFSTTSIRSGSPFGYPGATFRNGVLEVVLGHAMPLKVEVFDTRGTRLRSEGSVQAQAGVYRWDLARASRANQVLVVRTTVGGQTSTYRYTAFPDGTTPAIAPLRPTEIGGVLAREAAASDSLHVSASGYAEKTVPVPNLDATLDIALDTLSSSSAGRSAGCGKSPTLTSGARTITSGGGNRSYTLRIPPNYDKNHPYPLVFAYHWVGGTMGDVDGGGTSGYTWSYYGLREKADNSTDHKMIFVAGQGIGNGWGNGSNSDVAYTDDMTKLIENDLCVDTQRLFAMGFSYGGGMTKAIGCQRPKVFRAIAVYAGADFLSGGCDATTTSPIAYIGLHSINDGTNTYSSGVAIRDRFVKNNGCTPVTTGMPVNNNHVCTTYKGCKEGYPTEWCAFDGGGHTPAPVDGSSNGYGGGDKTWTKDEVWKFFTQF